MLTQMICCKARQIVAPILLHLCCVSLRASGNPVCPSMCVRMRVRVCEDSLEEEEERKAGREGENIVSNQWPPQFKHLFPPAGSDLSGEGGGKREGYP